MIGYLPSRSEAWGSNPSMLEAGMMMHTCDNSTQRWGQEAPAVKVVGVEAIWATWDYLQKENKRKLLFYSSVFNNKIKRVEPLTGKKNKVNKLKSRTIHFLVGFHFQCIKESNAKTAKD